MEKNPEDIAVNLNVPVSKVYTTLKTYILSHKEVSFKEFSTEIQKNIGVSVLEENKGKKRFCDRFFTCL